MSLKESPERWFGGHEPATQKAHVSSGRPQIGVRKRPNCRHQHVDSALIHSPHYSVTVEGESAPKILTDEFCPSQPRPVIRCWRSPPDRPSPKAPPQLATIITSAALVFVVFHAVDPDPVRPDTNAPRPIAARDTVFMEDMTWMEIRDAMRAGKEKAIVATGGIEQNGPYLVAGKHNIVLRATTEAIARKLGNALVAPIVPFVPEGDIDPPTLHMRYPSTLSLTEGTYRALLSEICDCLRTHGFRRIVLIGDSGGNQAGLEAVANDLNAKWSGGKSKIYYIKEYYNYPEVTKWLEGEGIKQTSEGLHDDFAI